MAQVLGKTMPIHFSATSIEMVRGILATCHVFLAQDVDEKGCLEGVSSGLRQRTICSNRKERTGIHRYPEPKLLAGTNYCDIGFERDRMQRLVVMSAIDNLMKVLWGRRSSP